MSLVQYTIDDFKQHLFDGFDYTLSPTTNELLDKLLGQLNIVDNDQHKKVLKPQPSQAQWNRSKPFKTTIIDKKEGLEKTMNDIRYCLNNISENNFQLQVTKIMEYWEMIPVTSYEQVVQFIVNNAVINKINSSLYAELLQLAMNIYPDVIAHVTRLPSEYCDSIQTITCISSTEDFELFCSVNKTNDERKGMVLFLVHLCKLGKVEEDIIANIIHSLMELIRSWIICPGKTNEVDELTENLFLFISMLTSLSSRWSSTIHEFSCYKPKQFCSLSSRAVFKFMDMNTILGKNS